jgi:2-methylcitrate dehydratase
VDSPMCTERLVSPRMERRRFLGQVAAAGLAAGASTFPAISQEMTERRSSAAGNSQVSMADALARYATDLKYEDLPEDIVRTAKRTILDTFGCAFGGYTAGPSQIAIKLASDVNAKRGATVLCNGIKTSPDLAAFANGVMIRYLDFNDAFVSITHGAGHPSDTIAALLAEAEPMGRSGRDLIAATVLSYEIFCKIADTFDYLGSGVDHSTITGFAAVVGASRLMGLSREQMVHAIGITVGGNTAIRQGRADTLSNWKAFAAADASRKAVFSAQLAQSGMTGPSNVFEGRLGFFNLISHKPTAPLQLGAPSPNASRLVSFLKPSPKLRLKRDSSSKTRTKFRKSTFGFPAPRSRSWQTVRTSGGRKPTKLQTTVSRMPPAWC